MHLSYPKPVTERTRILFVVIQELGLGSAVGVGVVCDSMMFCESGMGWGEMLGAV